MRHALHPDARRSLHEARSLAVRLQLKLGAVTEQDRLSDSPDTIVVVEPSVGSVGRTKGNLYLLVTCTVPGGKAREATRMIADTIRNEYYYDESAGIRQCLTKILGVANKRLAHQRDRYGLGARRRTARARRRRGGGGPRPRAVRRDRRPGRGLPDPPGAALHPAGPEQGARPARRGARARGLARRAPGGRLAVPRLGQRREPDRHRRPQGRAGHAPPAVRDRAPPRPLRRGRRQAAATAPSPSRRARSGATYKSQTLVPVRPAEPLAGAPDKGPSRWPTPPSAPPPPWAPAPRGPATPPATASSASSGGSRTSSRTAGAGSRKVTAATSRMETQRRAAVAAARVHRRGERRSSWASTPSRASSSPRGRWSRSRSPSGPSRTPRRPLDAVTGPGVDLITDDPRRALELLTLAYDKLDEAETAGYPVAEVAALRGRVTAGLDRLYGVVPVRSSTSSRSRRTRRVKLEGLVRGSDGAPYVLDAAAKTVWRIDLAKKTATPIAKSGQKASGNKVADPKIITTGGPDVLVLDTKNNLWRWRPLGHQGQGHAVQDQGRGLRLVGRRRERHVHVRRQLRRGVLQALHRRPVRAEHQGHVARQRRVGLPGEARRPAARPTGPVDGITDLLLDGDIFVAENGGVARVIPASGWTAQPPKDTQIRPNPELRDAVLARPARRLVEQAHRPDLRLRPHEPTASSRSTRPTGSTWSSTGSPTATRAGATCGTWWSCRAPTTRRPRRPGGSRPRGSTARCSSRPRVRPRRRRPRRPRRPAADDRQAGQDAQARQDPQAVTPRGA